MEPMDHEKITNRLVRIEGQIRGIKKMVEEDRECEDILVQISAASASLTNAARLVMEHHIEHCVVDGIKHGDEDETIRRLKKSLDQFSKLK